MLLSGLLLVSLFGCGSSSKEPLSTDTEDASAPAQTETESGGSGLSGYDGFQIVRSDSSSDRITKLAVALRNQMTSEGFTVKIVTDWDPEQISEREILIGKTSRPESARALEQLGNEDSLRVWIGSKLCIVATDDSALQEAVYSFMEEEFAYVREGINRFLMLTDYVPVTDGSADVSKEFDKAVSEARKTGKPIFVPLGEYVLSSSVRLDALTVVGEVRDGRMPVIRHTAPDRTLFILNNGAMVSNLTVEAADGAEAPEIELLSPGCQVKNVLIRNPYIGVCAGSLTNRSVNPGRLVLENVTVVFPSRAGLYVCGSRDTSWIRDCTVYADGKTVPYAFWLTDNDQIITSGLRAYGAEIGFNIDGAVADASGNYGGYWGTFTDCEAIGCSVGMNIGKGNHKCTLTGCRLYSRDVALAVADTTSPQTVVSISGCDFRSEQDATVLLDGARILNLSYSTIVQAGEDRPAVLLRGGTMTGISNNEITAKGTPVVIDTPDGSYSCSIVTNRIRTASPDGFENVLENDQRQILDNTVAVVQQISIDSVSYETVVEHKSSVSAVSASTLGHNVAEYGALGDGLRDDTEAFEKAIADARKDRLPVLVPQGNYPVSATLELDGVRVYGQDCISWTSDNVVLPRITHTVSDSPLFDLTGGAELCGLTIYSSYDAASDFDSSSFLSKSGNASEEIRIEGGGCSVSRLRIMNPYDGIRAGSPDGSFTCDDVRISQVFIIMPYHCGFYVGTTFDPSSIRDSEVWCNAGFGGYGFWFGSNKDLIADGLAIFSTKYGFYFDNTDGDGISRIQISNCGADFTQTGCMVERGAYDVTFTGSTFQDHFFGLNLTQHSSEDTSFVLDNCYLIGNGSEIVSLSGGANVEVRGCTILRLASHGNAVSVVSTKEVSLSGNCIYVNGTAVRISNKDKDALVKLTGNLFFCTDSTDVNADGSAASVESEGNASLVNRSIG